MGLKVCTILDHDGVVFKITNNHIWFVFVSVVSCFCVFLLHGLSQHAARKHRNDSRIAHLKQISGFHMLIHFKGPIWLWIKHIYTAYTTLVEYPGLVKIRSSVLPSYLSSEHNTWTVPHLGPKDWGAARMNPYGNLVWFPCAPVNWNGHKNHHSAIWKNKFGSDMSELLCSLYGMYCWKN